MRALIEGRVNRRDRRFLLGSMCKRLGRLRVIFSYGTPFPGAPFIYTVVIK